jgi:ABC-type uncharacterized transport system ATPase subunit
MSEILLALDGVSTPLSALTAIRLAWTGSAQGQLTMLSTGRNGAGKTTARTIMVCGRTGPHHVRRTRYHGT